MSSIRRFGEVRGLGRLCAAVAHGGPFLASRSLNPKWDDMGAPKSVGGRFDGNLRAVLTTRNNSRQREFVLKNSKG